MVEDEDETQPCSADASEDELVGSAIGATKTDEQCNEAPVGEAVRPDVDTPISGISLISIVDDSFGNKEYGSFAAEEENSGTLRILDSKLATNKTTEVNFHPINLFSAPEQVAEEQDQLDPTLIMENCDAKPDDVKHSFLWVDDSASSEFMTKPQPLCKKKEKSSYKDLTFGPWRQKYGLLRKVKNKKRKKKLRSVNVLSGENYRCYSLEEQHIAEQSLSNEGVAKCNNRILNESDDKWEKVGLWTVEEEAESLREVSLMLGIEWMASKEETIGRFKKEITKARVEFEKRRKKK